MTSQHIWADDKGVQICPCWALGWDVLPRTRGPQEHSPRGTCQVSASAQNVLWSCIWTCCLRGRGAVLATDSFIHLSHKHLGALLWARYPTKLCPKESPQAGSLPSDRSSWLPVSLLVKSSLCALIPWKHSKSDLGSGGVGQRGSILQESMETMWVRPQGCPQNQDCQASHKFPGTSSTTLAQTKRGSGSLRTAHEWVSDSSGAGWGEQQKDPGSKGGVLTASATLSNYHSAEVLRTVLSSSPSAPSAAAASHHHHITLV